MLASWFLTIVEFLEGAEHPFAEEDAPLQFLQEEHAMRKALEINCQTPNPGYCWLGCFSWEKADPMGFSLAWSFCCEKNEILLHEWILHMINAKTAVERRVTAHWGSPDSVSDADRVAVGAHKRHCSPKIQFQPSHCMKVYTYKHKQEMKNGCLSSNWGAAFAWTGYGSMEEGVQRRKGKQGMDRNRGRETACACVSGSNPGVFYEWL